jgi:competence protein ComEC
VDFLWPDNFATVVAPIAKNNDSLVVRLHYGDRTIMLPGDAEKQVEYSMLAENNPGFLHTDVLKIGHHGSKNSTMPELLARLEQKGTRILRTDRDGAVQIRTNGQSLLVSCYIACPEGTTPQSFARR